MNTCNICKKSTNLKNFIKFGKFPYANFPVDLKKFKKYIIKKKTYNRTNWQSRFTIMFFL